MSERILFVDDEPAILDGLRRTLRRQFVIDTAVGATEGLAALERESYAVVVSDLRMPDIDGVKFLSMARDRWPHAVRVMLTGENDLQATIRAVNAANLFRFLTKPCDPEELTKTMEAALVQHRLVIAERELLEKTLSGSVRVLVEVLSLASPRAFSRALSAKRYARHIADRLRHASPWQVEIAAMLSQLGTITLPPEILDRLVAGQRLDAADAALAEGRFKVAAGLIAHIPRLDPVARMIAMQPAVTQEGLGDGSVPEGARMLHVALQLDLLIAQGQSGATAIAALRTRLGPRFATYLEAVAGMDHGDGGRQVRAIRCSELQLGMVVDEDVRTRAGLLLVGKGQEVTDAVIQRLQGYAVRVGITEPFRVVVPA